MYAKGLRSTSIAMDGGVSRKGKLIENNSSVWKAPLRSLSPSHLIYSNSCCSFFNTCLTLLNFLKYCICRHFLCRPRFCCCCCWFNLSLWLPRWWWRWLLVVVVCSACFVLLLIPFSLHFFSPFFFLFVWKAWWCMELNTSFVAALLFWWPSWLRESTKENMRV